MSAAGAIKESLLRSVGTLSATRAPGSLFVDDGTVEALKWLGLFLMVVDHANKYLANAGFGWAFHAGRICLPLFCFVLAYNLTRVGVLESGSFKRVMNRTAIVGGIATPIFIALGGLPFGWLPLNIFFTFCVATLMLLFVARRGRVNMTCAVLIFLVGGLFVEYWWFALALVLACWAFCNKPGAGSFMLVIFATAGLYAINRNFWAFAALPIIALAPFVSMPVPRMRNIFYIFYPLHLAALLGLRTYLGLKW
jgi:TraX protein